MTDDGPGTGSESTIEMYDILFKTFIVVKQYINIY